MDAPANEPGIRARRATVDDLPGLHALWQGAGLPWDELERFVTEFILVPNDDGLPLAAIGLQAEGDQGLVHSEAVMAGDDADVLRAALWQRLQIIARNQGIARLWTLEDAPFWLSHFPRAPDADVASLQASFADPSVPWRTFVLRDPARAQRLLDERMALWEAHRQSDAEHFTETVARIRKVAFIIAGLVIVMMIGMVAYLVARRPDAFQTLMGRFQHR